MMHSFRVYLLYFAQFLKARLDYKWDFFTGILASMFSTLGGLLFVTLLIDGKSVPDLKGWNREQVLFIYGYALMASSIFGLFAPNLYRFGERYIVEGQFDRVLLRPLNSLFQVLFESFNLDTIGTFALGVTLFFYNASRLQMHLGVLDLAWLVVSALSGAVILISVFAALSSVAFHFEDRLGLAPPMVNLMAFSRYPLPIYNRFVQGLLSFVIPFAFVSFYPATHFFGMAEYRAFCYSSPLVAVICVAVAGVLWRFGISRYSSTGN